MIRSGSADSAQQRSMAASGSAQQPDLAVAEQASRQAAVPVAAEDAVGAVPEVAEVVVAEAAVVAEGLRIHEEHSAGSSPKLEIGARILTSPRRLFHGTARIPH